MKKTYLLSFLIFLILIASYVPLFFLSYKEAIILVKEEGIIQNCSAICYLFSACLMFYLFFRSKSKAGKYLFNARRNYLLFLLGLFLLVCLGEEISWGQRIFKIETPTLLKEVNRQDEINLHNLAIFHGLDLNDKPKKGLEVWITASVIYSLFWLFYCVFIPVLSLVSSKWHMILTKISFPVVPLWIGFMFPLNYLIAKAIQKFDFLDITSSLRSFPLTEIKENDYAILYLFVCISFCLFSLRSVKNE